jgi:hypothetical protein
MSTTADFKNATPNLNIINEVSKNNQQEDYSTSIIPEQKHKHDWRPQSYRMLFPLCSKE